MRAFPQNWVAPQNAAILPAKIKHLLEKFGKLSQAPTVTHTSSGIVATAVFESGPSARQAAGTLHGVDNRTEPEKRAAGGRKPQEGEMFHVQVVPDGTMPEGAPHMKATAASGASPAALQPASTTPGVATKLRPPSAAPSATPSSRQPAASAAGQARKPAAGACRLQLQNLPQEWTPQDIQELCCQYGVVDSVFLDGPGGFIVVFRDPDTASAASNALSGLQLQTESGTFNALSCNVLPGDDESSAVGPLHDGGAPLVMYVDELMLGREHPCLLRGPGAEDREIFLQDLPLEDYTEQQLREWLDDFGSVAQVVFCRDPGTKALTGRGYVRFSSHEEAAGLIAAFPQTEGDEGNVKGCWSLSERLLQGSTGPFKTDVVKAIASRLQSLQRDLRCAALHFAGDTRPGNAELKEMMLGAGPLHFVCSRHHRLGTPEALRNYFADMLVMELGPPAPPRRPSAAAKAAEPEPEMVGPRIEVRGFPVSWQAQQVKLVFAVFGGVSQVQLSEDSQGRFAHVQLKNPDNMKKAVDQLNNTQVGDGEMIEECTIACRLLGADGKAAPSSHRTLFIDELSMRGRPEVQPGDKDREVFLQSLPVKECTEDQIRAWLEGFGQVEDMHLLRDAQSGDLDGKGYVRFATHDEAAACIEAQASAGDAEDGDVVAQWSESERAAQKGDSVYGSDLMRAFSSRQIESVRRASKVSKVWMVGKGVRASVGAPAAEAQQLHFIVEAGDGQLSTLKKELSAILEDFHFSLGKSSDAAGRTRRGSPERGEDSKAAKESRPRDAEAPSQRKRQHTTPSSAPAAEQGSQRPAGEWPGPPPAGAIVAQPQWPPGYGPLPGQDPWGWARGPPPPRPYGPPPPGWPPHPGFPPPPGKAEWGPGAPPPGKGDWKGAPPPPDGRWGYPGWGPYPERPPGDHGVPAPGPPPGGPAPAGGHEVHARDPAAQENIEKGEGLVHEAKELVERGSSTKKAYERYCRGLQILLGVMPKLPEDDPSAQGLRLRVDGYLEEAERLKNRLDGGGAGVEGRNHGSSRDHGRGGGDEKKDRLSEKLDAGEALVAEGKAADDVGLVDEAYEKYCKGLQLILEVMPQLGEGPAVAPLRKKVSSYLERAEKLKKKKADGDRGGRSAQEKSRGGGDGTRHRSRSRDRRHKERSRSRRGGRRGSPTGGRDRKSRSRRRDSGTSRARDMASTRGLPPGAPPGRFGPPPKAPGPGQSRGLSEEAEATKPKTPGPGLGPPPPSSSRGPPGPQQPLLRPKSGQALLVGKAAMKR